MDDSRSRCLLQDLIRRNPIQTSLSTRCGRWWLILSIHSWSTGIQRTVIANLLFRFAVVKVIPRLGWWPIYVHLFRSARMIRFSWFGWWPIHIHFFRSARMICLPWLGWRPIHVDLLGSLAVFAVGIVGRARRTRILKHCLPGDRWGTKRANTWNGIHQFYFHNPFVRRILCRSSSSSSSSSSISTSGTRRRHFCVCVAQVVWRSGTWRRLFCAFVTVVACSRRFRLEFFCCHYRAKVIKYW